MPYLVEQRVSIRQLTTRSLRFVAVFLIFKFFPRINWRAKNEILDHQKEISCCCARHNSTRFNQIQWMYKTLAEFSVVGQMLYPLQNALVFTRHVARIVVWFIAAILDVNQVPLQDSEYESSSPHPSVTFNWHKSQNISSGPDSKTYFRVNWSVFAILCLILKNIFNITYFTITFITLFNIMLFTNIM